MSETDQYFVFNLQPFACIAYNYYYYLLGIYSHGGKTFEELLERQPVEISRDFAGHCAAVFPRVPNLTPYELLCIKSNPTVRRNVIKAVQLLLSVMGCNLGDCGARMTVTNRAIKNRYLTRHGDDIKEFLDKVRLLGFAELEGIITNGLQ